MQTINVGNYYADELLQNDVRSLAGPVLMGAVTYDTLYPRGFARWIYVGTTGNLSLTMWNGDSITLPNLAAGVWHPIPSAMVNASGTTIAANQLFWGC